EEVEHRTVGYDAYRALAGDGVKGYLGRQLSMGFAFAAMVGFWLGSTVYLCHLDGTKEAQKIAKKNPLALVWLFQKTAKKKKSLPDLGMI
ncbi:metal-dependent hydrolase, partial [Klebsiella pneumoniae]|nr:metal-dependent hydrolase [Klebsiella pneumoniae]